MTSFPTSIASFRSLENLPGITYNPDDKKTLYAEDMQKAYDEIQAIESTLGTNPQGSNTTVADRLDGIEANAGGGPYGESIYIGTSGSDIEIDASQLVATKLYNIHAVLITAANVNTQIDVKVNNVTTYGQYYGHYIRAYGTTISASTLAAGTLTNIEADKYVEITGTVKISATKKVYIETKASHQSATAVTEQRHTTMNYRNGANADITSIKLTVGYGGGFAAGSYAVITEASGAAY